MNHFIDYTNHLSKQTFSAAAIVDSGGKQVGEIIIRFTQSQIGYNHQVGVIFHPAELDFSNNKKGGTHEQPGTLFYILREAGVKAFNFGGDLITTYGDKAEGRHYNSMSRFDEIITLKYKRKIYRILWVM